MAIKNRTDLKSYFVKNAIPTEGNFADLIDSPLNQSQDGIFKPDGDALSVVAAPGDQKRVLRLYGNYPAANPDWMVSLNPSLTGTGVGRAGLGISDGTGISRLFIDTATGRVGIATNNPGATLDVVGNARASTGFAGRYDTVLNDYRTVAPTQNVILQSPPNDRDAWVYRDSADASTNWGIYHRQIDSTVQGLPANSIGFIGGGSSKLQAYICLGDGSLMSQGGIDVSTGRQALFGWYEAIRLTRPEHAAITHPGGQLLFGMHSNRSFYFADVAGSRYVMQINAATGEVSVPGQTSATGGVVVEGTVAHLDRDGAFYRNTDGQVYITVDDNLYIRDSGSGATWAAHFDTNAGNLDLKGQLSAKSVVTHGYGMLTDPDEKFNCHFPFSDNCSYVTGNNVYLRGGQPTGFNTVVTMNATDKTLQVVGNIGVRGYGALTGLPPTWGGGVNSWDVVAHGTMWSVNGYKNGAFDLAEKFANHAAELEAGDVVQPDPKSPERLIRSQGAQSDVVLGVVSTAPGFELGVSWEDPTAGVPLALAGRVPVKVNLEGGAIRIGDYLASSSEPGVAMRTIRPGRVIGIALSAFDGTEERTGKVVVMVNPHWFAGR